MKHINLTSVSGIDDYVDCNEALDMPDDFIIFISKIHTHNEDNRRRSLDNK